MIVKGIALTALVASTPLALFATQEIAGGAAQDPTVAVERTVQQHDHKAELQRANSNLKRARVELKAAQRELRVLRNKLGAALDRLDAHAEPGRNHERSCSPSRSRTMMSHYQWMRDQEHKQRAEVALAKVVKQVGDDPSRINSVAWNLMTDKGTAGKFDELALALTKHMEAVGNTKKKNGRQRRLDHNHLDTAALANFLNGKVEQAIRLQQKAIEKGGRGDDFRRRLRTYEAARTAVAKAQRGVTLPAATMVASNEEEDEE